MIQFSDAFSSGDIDSLQKSLGALSLDENTKEEAEKEKLSNVLMSLRKYTRLHGVSFIDVILTPSPGKLREALLNSVPDDFTKSVFMFSIRVSTRIGHYQTYIPSITYLLKHSRILSKPELNEVSSLYALHLAHFNNEHTKALEVLFDYSPDDLHLHQILTSFRNKEYHTWLNLFHKEKDVSKYRIMKFGEPVMVQHAIDCIQKSYFQLPSSYVNHLFEISVESLCKEYNCSWKKDNATVVIRERR